MSKVNSNSEDDWSFSEEMARLEDVKPMAQDTRIYHGCHGQDLLSKQLRRKALEKELGEYQNYLTTGAVQPIAPDDVIAYKKDGVQAGVFKNFRLGKYQLENSMSLFGINFKAARAAVFQFVVDSYNQGSRVVLIKHGMGIKSKPFAGFYKSYVNEWLRSMPEIIAFHTALRAHGGYGAVYVLLKKNEQQKQDNRERHKLK